jgi:pimeloyl-ACP methyl ester carboxylesterase
VLRPLRDTLRASGHRVWVAPLGFNVGCGEAAVATLERWVADVGDGAPVVVVGHSRGGLLARVLAVRRPDLVSRLITVSTPWSIGPPDRPGVAAVTAALQRVRRAGLPVMASIECATGECCVQFREDMARKPAAPWTALWSSTDRFAGDDAFPPPEADKRVDLRTGHVGAVTSGAARATIVAEVA